MFSGRTPVSVLKSVNVCCRAAPTSGERAANKASGLQSGAATKPSPTQRGPYSVESPANEPRLTVKVVQNLRDSRLCLDRVDQRKVVIQDSDDAQVVVVVPNWKIAQVSLVHFDPNTV